MKCEKCGGLVMNRSGGAACINCGWRLGEPVRRFAAPKPISVALTKKGHIRERMRRAALEGGQ